MTSDVDQLSQIQDLLAEATTKRSQSALKKLVCHFYTWAMWLARHMLHQLFRRDGFRCPFTNLSFVPPGNFVNARSAHILPFSFHDKVCSYMFCGDSTHLLNYAIASHTKGT